MKFTQCLCKQHIGRMIRFIWQVQRERKVSITPAENILASMGFDVKDPFKLLAPKPKEPCKLDREPMVKIVVRDETHPDWKETPCFHYQDRNVLQVGVQQAQALTKTICIADKLPTLYNDLIKRCPKHVHPIVQRHVYSSTVFDAYQELLPKIKDPERPAWVFPREYGLSCIRKLRNLSRRFLQVCDLVSDPDVVRARYVVQDELASTTINYDSYILHLNLTMDLMLLSSTATESIKAPTLITEHKLPDISPMHPLIGIQKENIYNTDNVFPVDETLQWKNVHTIFIYNDPTVVKNITELPVTETQVHARALMKSFTIAATAARKRFGLAVETLPEPITIQCIQSDGQKYHFSVFQLNTLQLDKKEGRYNFWWSAPTVKLYKKAGYENGRPILEGYNPEVFDKFYAFYNKE